MHTCMASLCREHKNILDSNVSLSPTIISTGRRETVRLYLIVYGFLEHTAGVTDQQMMLTP